jgi:hypothetical protein
MSLELIRSPGRNGQFPVSRRGYSPRHVDEHLRLLDAQFRMVAADRDAVVEHRAVLASRLEHCQRESVRLAARLRELSAAPVSPKAISARVRVMLELAGEQAVEARAEARQEAEAELTQAHLDRRRAQQLRRWLESCRRQVAAQHARATELVEQATRQVAELLAQARVDADRLANQAEAHRQHLDEQAARRRARTEREFVDEVAARRAQLEIELSQVLEQARANGQRLLDQARAQAELQMSQARHNADAVVNAAADERAEANRVLSQAREDARRILTDTQARADLVRTRADAEARRTLDQTERRASTLAEAARHQSARLGASQTQLYAAVAALRDELDHHLTRLNVSDQQPIPQIPAQRQPTPAAKSPATFTSKVKLSG